MNEAPWKPSASTGIYFISQKKRDLFILIIFCLEHFSKFFTVPRSARYSKDRQGV